MKFPYALAFALLGASAFSAHAATCRQLKFTSDDIVSVHSALNMGTRIQLPANLISAPAVSNAHLWDVGGVIGTNQLVIKPNSALKEGESTMIYAFTDDGGVIDISAARVPVARNQPCLLLDPTPAFFDEKSRGRIRAFTSAPKQGASRSSADIARITQLEKEIELVKSTSELERKQSIINALKKYRYRIYTRYSWDEGTEFVGRNTISDVYDDGQFTYIRLANPNRGILSVETLIGGKNAIAPTSYIDEYAMYKVTGIYPQFTLRVDEVTIDIKRVDNQTTGNL
nr:hypothetical protein [Aliivibrio fischeri]OED53639.1 hypothetical protein BEI47_17440 [Aliivibrio fischeri]